ncbi:MAG: ribosomal protein S18-alanine N-acetyltransferase [Actinobacteria bacterium]|jgi:ribosomal-protein-alanine N-acetyltransferase|nr:ribosomal protein S18-alanine N-acetyltransferase [Actinomycetota bacterium]
MSWGAQEESREVLELEIVPMRRWHLRGVLRIENQVYPRPWSAGLFLSELSLGPERAYHVARSGRRILGYSGTMFVEEDAHVTNIAVDPAWQRRGIGRSLLLNIVRTAWARGAVNLTLEVRISNTGAQELYRSFGFQPVGLRKNYYAETGEDAIVMWVYNIKDEEYLQRIARLEVEASTKVRLVTPPPTEGEKDLSSKLYRFMHLGNFGRDVNG